MICNFCGVKGNLANVCFKKHSNLPSKLKSADSSKNASQPRRISVNNARTNTFEQTMTVHAVHDCQKGFNVTSIQNLNLIGRRAMVSINIDLNALLRTQSLRSIGVPPFHFRKKCELLCEGFNELFSTEVGCLEDFELQIRFKPDSRLIFL